MNGDSQEKPEQEFPHGCNSSPKSLSYPKGSFAAHLVQRDPLGDQLCACCCARAVPAGSSVGQSWCHSQAAWPWEMAQWKTQTGGFA